MKKGLLYAILASVLWAIVNPFIKQGLSYDFTPMNFAGLRFTIPVLPSSLLTRVYLINATGTKILHPADRKFILYFL